MEMQPGEPVSEPAPTGRSPRRRVLLLCAAVIVVLVAAAVWLLVPSGPPPLTQADVDRAVQQGIEQAQRAERGAPADAAVAYRTIAPSLVSITALAPVGAVPGSGSGSGSGSGVVVSGDGIVLTALHVVEGAGQIQVGLADGTTTTARVVMAQPSTDIAVLALDGLPQLVVPAVLGGPPAVGETVFAVGDPLGLRASLSAGVVSGDERRIGTQRGTQIDGLIQFDAAVNPGNSGGPLLNRDGQVVGIVTALANPGGQDFFVGIGFAVPIATAGGAAGGPQQ
jgi:S1-C subfamily serine protease